MTFDPHQTYVGDEGKGGGGGFIPSRYASTLSALAEAVGIDSQSAGFRVITPKPPQPGNDEAGSIRQTFIDFLSKEFLGVQDKAMSVSQAAMTDVMGATFASAHVRTPLDGAVAMRLMEHVARDATGAFDEVSRHRVFAKRIELPQKHGEPCRRVVISQVRAPKEEPSGGDPLENALKDYLATHASNLKEVARLAVIASLIQQDVIRNKEAKVAVNPASAEEAPQIVLFGFASPEVLTHYKGLLEEAGVQVQQSESQQPMLSFVPPEDIPAFFRTIARPVDATPARRIDDATEIMPVEGTPSQPKPQVDKPSFKERVRDAVLNGLRMPPS